MQNKPASDKLLIGGIVISMFLWGLSWPSGKVLSGYCSVMVFSVCRYIMVVLAMLVLMLLTRNSLKIAKRGIPALIASGLLLALYSYSYYMGIKNGAPGAGGVLVTTLNPIAAYSIGILISRKRPSRNETLGLVLGALAGCILLRLWENTHAVFESGNIYFLLASLTWAVMSKFTSKGATYGSSLGFSLWQYMVTLLCFLPFLPVKEFISAIHITAPLFLINLVFTSAIVTSLATTIYFYSTTRLGAEKASSFIFLVPLAAAVSSWLLLGEHILPHTIIGGILGIAAVFMINKKKAVIADRQ